MLFKLLVLIALMLIPVHYVLIQSFKDNPNNMVSIYMFILFIIGMNIFK